ncbi:DUF2283 domain-containing protein [Nocardiopsis lambiniae]|uniref:DUF2283 domain-containing protein n=1 Tax=Nocardiopsis lambiniae TaxID=3075539 RepID=A0ABU2M603_9ACTN|nr:DUF2283 domain-containing protein [Nocardiopsis sp. DSM 44743]MDT0328098.1 DUF2283 domain-containing protein [Nocardiopsis sp. DSM 44743]
MKISYDAEVDAAYITVVDHIGDGEAETQRHSIPTPDPEGEIVLDFDARGFLLGVEVLGASRVLRPELLATAEAE